MPEEKPKPAAPGVDGLRRSTEPIRRVRPPAPHRERHLKAQPLPQAVGESHQHRNVIHPDPHLRAAEIMHPHGVSHPALPLPTSRAVSHLKLSIWSGVLKPSLTEIHDRRTVWASLGITLASPFTWLLVILPALTIYASDIQHESAGKLFAQFAAWINGLTASQVVIFLTVSALTLGLVWLIRHTCLLVAYGIQVRRIDNRLVSGRQVWWQSLAKIWRLIVVAAIDIVLSAALMTGGMMALARIAGLADTTQFTAWWSLFFNFTLLVIILAGWLMATHRPLARVMLSITNRPASFVIIRGFGLVFRNWWRALGIGLIWLMAAGLTATLVAGISWSTIVYGLVQVTTTIGRSALWAVSGALILFVLTCFTVWSTSYWPRAYHVLAHRGYPKTVSQLMNDELHAKSRRATLVHVALLVLLYVGLVVGITLVAQPRIATGLEQIQRRIPTSLDQLLPTPPSR